MLLSYSHRFLFIHVPKTGGSSISRALAECVHRPEDHWVNRTLGRVGIHVNLYGPERVRRYRFHSTARVLRRHLSEETFESSFKFAFVRNPWDRMVSSYHFVAGCATHHRHRQVARGMNFKDYLRYEVARGKMSQAAMLTDRSGRLLVDFVGRFERLAEDFHRVCQHLGLPCQLGHHNRSRHRDYREYYDRESIELVRRHFGDEIDLFGYDFQTPMAVHEIGANTMPRKINVPCTAR